MKSVKSDIEIARAAALQPVTEIAAKLNIPQDHLFQYGPYKGKVSLPYLTDLQTEKTGKLILVTAISPTPAGEGKTTTTVGLGDALNRIGKKAMICISSNLFKIRQILEKFANPKILGIIDGTFCSSTTVVFKVLL